LAGFALPERNQFLRFKLSELEWHFIAVSFRSASQDHQAWRTTTTTTLAGRLLLIVVSLEKTTLKGAESNSRENALGNGSV